MSLSQGPCRALWRIAEFDAHRSKHVADLVARCEVLLLPCASAEADQQIDVRTDGIGRILGAGTREVTKFHRHRAQQATRVLAVVGGQRVAGPVHGRPFKVQHGGDGCIDVAVQ